jgi:hypothetical protein
MCNSAQLLNSPFLNTEKLHLMCNKCKIFSLIFLQEERRNGKTKKKKYSK